MCIGKLSSIREEEKARGTRKKKEKVDVKEWTGVGGQPLRRDNQTMDLFFFNLPFPAAGPMPESVALQTRKRSETNADRRCRRSRAIEEIRDGPTPQMTAREGRREGRRGEGGGERIPFFLSSKGRGCDDMFQGF